MPIALRSNGGVTISRSDFIHGVPRTSIRDRSSSPERDDDSNSSSASSIGRNSDSSGDSSDREDSGETEVRSSFKGPLETVNTLEEGLPGKKGISKFYSGKSKSFTSLSDATSATSIQDIVKPEDPYAKKRKNLLAHNMFANRSRSYACNLGGIPKRSSNLSRGISCIALSSSSSSSNSSSNRRKGYRKKRQDFVLQKRLLGDHILGLICSLLLLLRLMIYLVWQFVLETKATRYTEILTYKFYITGCFLVQSCFVLSQRLLLS